MSMMNDLIEYSTRQKASSEIIADEEEIIPFGEFVIPLKGF